MINNKKKKVIAILLLLAIGLIFYLIAQRQKFGGIPNQTGQIPFDEQEYWQHPRQYMLSYLNSVPLSEYDTFFSSGNVTTADGEKVYTIYYMPNSPDTVINKIKKNANHPEDDRGTYRGGILAFFKKNNSFSIIWESKEYFSAMKGITEFKDIDNDGIDELVLTAGQGVRLVPALWIYKWNHAEFKLINPNPDADKESDRWMAGVSAQLEDIDGDKIFEAVVVNESTSLKTGEIEATRRTYKFNGQEYYLWKEEKVNQ